LPQPFGMIFLAPPCGETKHAAAAHLQHQRAQERQTISTHPALQNIPIDFGWFSKLHNTTMSGLWSNFFSMTNATSWTNTSHTF